MLLAALVVVRASISRLTWTVAAWVVFVAGIAIGIGIGRLAASRLSFQASEGLLAADALNPRTSKPYVAVLHGVGLALMTVVTLIVRPSLLAVSVSAYVLGALISGLVDGVGMPKHIARERGRDGAYEHGYAAQSAGSSRPRFWFSRCYRHGRCTQTRYWHSTPLRPYCSPRC